MKKYVLSLLFLIAFALPVKAQSPWDMIYHAVPVAPSFDITEEISQISGQIQAAIGQGKKIIMTFKTDATSLQSAIMSTFNKIKSGAILDILGNPGQSPTSFCGKEVTKTKPKEIAKKVKEILLIAKSDDFSYVTEHQKKREKFYMDNVYAIYAASLITQQEIENDIKAKIDKAKSCAEGKGGECGIPSTDEGGNNEAIFTYGKTLEAMDSVVRLWESIAALKARLAAVKMIYGLTPALDAKAAKKGGDQAFLNIPQAIAKSHSSTPMAFAQLELQKRPLNLRAVSKDDKSANEVVVANEKTETTKTVKLSDVKPSNLRSKFVEAQKADMERIDVAKRKIAEAKANKVKLKETNTSALKPKIEDIKEASKLESVSVEKKALTKEAVKADLKVSDKVIDAQKVDLKSTGVANGKIAEASGKATQAKEAVKADLKVSDKVVGAQKANLKSVDVAKDKIAETDGITATENETVSDDATKTEANTDTKDTSENVDANNLSTDETVASDTVKNDAELSSEQKDANLAEAEMTDEAKTALLNEAKAKLDTNTVMKALDVKSAAQNLNKTTMEQVEAAAMVKKENETMQYIVNTIEFVSPDVNEEEHALASVQEEMEATGEMSVVEGLVSHAIEAHNFIKELPIHRDTAKRYIEMQQRYKDAFDRLVKSEECSIRYLNGFYTKPHLVWSGNLPLDKANKHELRKGISGWAYNAFELLKSGEASNVIEAFKEAEEKLFSEDTEEVEEDDSYLTDENALNEKINNTMNTSSSNPDEIAQDNISNEEAMEMGDDNCELLDEHDSEECKAQAEESGKKKKKKRFTEDSANNTMNTSISDDKKKRASSEARKSDLYAWQIGAESSKLLADEDWGSPSRNRKMIWTDTKRFYKKYLEKKYDNVFRHMSSISEADMLELIAEKLVGNDQSITAGSYQKERKAKIAELVANAQEAFRKRQEAREKKRKEYEAKMNAIDAEKKQIEAEINELSEEVIAIKSEIDAVKSAAAESVIKNIQEKLTAPLKFPKEDEKPQDTIIASIERTSLASQANTEAAEEINKNEEIKEKEARVKEIQIKLASLVAKQMQKTLEAEKVKRKGQEDSLSPEELAGVANIETQLLNAISGGDGKSGALGALQAKAKNNAMTKIKDILNASNEENPIEDFDIDVVERSINEGVLALILKAQAEAIKIIKTEGLLKMYALGDDLFIGKNYPKVQKIHNDMIDKLRAVKLSFNIGTKLISPLIQIKDIAVFDEFLKDVDISPELEGFFVGSTPKERDLQAPYSLANEDYDLPPVREVFHFDAVDFGNLKAPVEEENVEGEEKDWIENLFNALKDAIEKAKKAKTIDKKDFLEFGGDIPKIWKKMLEDKPFIDSRLPLGEILQGEDDSCEQAAFVRGGVMPCLYGDGKYYMDINLNGNYVYGAATAAHKNLQPCSLVVPVSNSRPYHKFWKVELNKLTDTHLNPKAIDCEYSEMGMLFRADEHNNLFIKDHPFKNYNRVNRRDGDPIDKMLPLTKKNLAAARHSELGRNQIGDFLKQAESEKVAQETLEESRKAFEDSKEALYALFKEFGFVPSEKFNLANSADYKKAENVLKAVKKQRLQKAVETMNKIKISKDNKPAKEKNRNMNRLINFMNTDIESVLKISMADADSKDLAIRLAKEIINEKIMGIFKKKNEKTKEETESIEEAYCATY